MSLIDMTSACDKLNSQDVDGVHDKSSSSRKHCSTIVDHRFLNDPQDTQGSDGDDISDVEEEYDELEGIESKPDEKCLSPWPGYLSPDASSDKEDKDFETALQRIFSEPTPLKLVSAIKGSREKQGLSSRKLTVSWAPDVYDPVPTIVSHTRGKKQQKSKNKDKEKDNNKKNGKRGQKGGNSSRGGGSGGKDKKQFRKNARERFVDSADDLDDFGSSDSYCGGSFLKNSLNKVHFSVAEAL